MTNARNNLWKCQRLFFYALKPYLFKEIERRETVFLYEICKS